MTLRVVFDTNILISAILSQRTNPFRCLQIARDGVVQSVTCQEILNEFEEKLLGKFNYEPQRAQAFIDDVRNYSQLVAISNTLQAVSADPDDDMVLECAVVGNVNYIVTGDKHLLSLGSYQDILIVKATEFLVRLSQS